MTRLMAGLTLGLGLFLLSGCNFSAEEARRREAEARAQAEAAQRQAEDAEKRAEEAKKRAEEEARKAQAKLEEAARLLHEKEAELEITKVLKSEKEFDIVFARPVEGDEQVKEHQSKMKKMDHVKIDNLEVAYEQEDKLTVNSKTYKRHFRVLYVKDSRVYGFSYYTMEEIDGAAFANLLRKLFPIVDEQMTKYQIEVKRGQP